MANDCVSVWTLCVFAAAGDRWIPIVRKDDLEVVRGIATQLRFAIVEPICLIETPDDAEFIEEFLLTIPKEHGFSEVFLELWREFQKRKLIDVDVFGTA